MQRSIHQLTIKSVIMIVAVSFPVSVALAGLTPANAVDTSPPIAVKAIEVESVEARIEALHERLKITQAQEELWNNVAQVMRENAQTMSTILAKIGSHKGNTETPVDDMKFYGEITDAHAASVKKFIPVFEALYNGLSDAQKKAIKETDLKF